MKNKKSYWIKTENGNIGRATFDGNKKPSKKVLDALCKAIDLANKELEKKSLSSSSVAKAKELD